MKLTNQISLPLLSFLLLIFLLHSPTAKAQVLYQICGSTNFTANSTYQSNLNRLLSSFTTNVGFGSGMIGSVPNQISGLVLCRGDVNSTTCSSCFSQATNDAQNLCPYTKEATIYYDFCLLRYSSESSIFWTDDKTPGSYMWNTQNVTGSKTRFVEIVNELMNSTSQYASDNSSIKFGTGMMMNSTDKFPTIYSLVQCTPDSSDSGCMSCLSDLIGQIPQYFSGRQGGRILGWRCNLRYETYPFYDGVSLLKLSPTENITPAPAPAAPTGNITQAPAPSLSPPGIVILPTNGEKKKHEAGKVPTIAISVGIVFIAIVALCVSIMKRRRAKLKQPLLNVSNPEEIKSMESLLLDLFVLRAATVNFANENKLGEGGFGSVYKGVLPDGREIAVKRLSETSGQGLGELNNELVLVAKLQHKNLVRLLGVCLEENEKILVYEYVPNKSLDQILFDNEKRQMLDWGKRYKIISGVARGLLYLHEDSQLRVIHRDLKASNVLLDADMSPKISDFGLARLFGVDQTQDVTNRVVGTFGYMPPEYAMQGQFSIKSDVFSYGVLVLETISGKKNTGPFKNGEAEYLLSSVWRHWINGTITAIVDVSFGQNYPRSDVLRCIHIGLLCVQNNPTDRPMMSNVVIMLSTETVSLPPPLEPAFCVGICGPQAGPVKYSYNGSIDPFSLNEVTVTDVEPR